MGYIASRRCASGRLPRKAHQTCLLVVISCHVGCYLHHPAGLKGPEHGLPPPWVIGGERFGPSQYVRPMSFPVRYWPLGLSTVRVSRACRAIFPRPDVEAISAPQAARQLCCTCQQLAREAAAVVRLPGALELVPMLQICGGASISDAQHLSTVWISRPSRVRSSL